MLIQSISNKIFVDYDEKVNINYAIKNALVITKDELNRLDDDIKLIDNFFSISNIKDYNAIIDVVGLFKNNIKFKSNLFAIVYLVILVLYCRVFSFNTLVRFASFNLYFNRYFSNYSSSCLVFTI